MTNNLYSATEYAACKNIDHCTAIRELHNSQKLILSSLSHEIRNPLTLISSTMQLMEKEHPELTDYRHWTQVRQDIAGVIDLLNNLSAYNNCDRLNQKIISASSFFQEISEQFAPSALLQKKRFSFIAENNLPDFTGDPLKLKEVIINLLKNSLEATEEGDSITLDVSTKDRTLLIKVTDNGCGIAPEYLSSLFEPFVTHKPTGTGLGLAIAKGIIASHQGDISVESRKNNGTVFTICLPLI